MLTISLLRELSDILIGKTHSQAIIYLRSSGAVLQQKELTPEEKVNLAINMTDAVTQVCANGIKDQNPGITKAKLEAKLRERLTCQKRQHQEV
jgi:hypothetical protein